MSVGSFEESIVGRFGEKFTFCRMIDSFPMGLTVSA